MRSVRRYVQTPRDGAHGPPRTMPAPGGPCTPCAAKARDVEPGPKAPGGGIVGPIRFSQENLMG